MEENVLYLSAYRKPLGGYECSSRLLAPKQELVPESNTSTRSAAGANKMSEINIVLPIIASFRKEWISISVGSKAPADDYYTPTWTNTPLICTCITGLQRHHHVLSRDRNYYQRCAVSIFGIYQLYYYYTYEAICRNCT